MVLCGASQIDITPDHPVFLAGYGERNRPSEGVHDPLFAAVLYLNDQSTETVLISLDLIGVDTEFTLQVRNTIHNAAGIPAANITISCTHTHSGPIGTVNTFPREEIKKDEALRAEISAKLAQTALVAKQKATRADLKIGKCSVKGIGSNRNDPSIDIDSELTLVAFVAQNGPIALLVNYGCHPTVMSAANYLISADFPGAARFFVQQQYPDCVLVFTNSGAGDVSTRFTRQGQGFAEVERFGRIYAEAITACLVKAQHFAISDLRMRTTAIQLPIRTFPNPQEADRILQKAEENFAALKASQASTAEIRAAETKVFGARTQLRFSKHPFTENSVTAEVQLFKLGNFVYVTLPGEPYSAIVREIKTAFPDKAVAVISYANDYFGYFPIYTADQTYETLKSPFPESIGETITAQTIALLKDFIKRT